MVWGRGFFLFGVISCTRVALEYLVLFLALWRIWASDPPSDSKPTFF